MSFKQIKGANRRIQILKSARQADRLPSTYLFSGPEGIGKGLVAKTFAKFINCLDNKDGEPCDRCTSCIKIEKGIHPDVHWLSLDVQAADSSYPTGDSIKIEQVRQVQKDISLRPYEAKIKIFIINDADRLTLEAANAFLKVLEEPPKDSLIILITAKPKLLPATIISRCQKLKFAPLEKNSLEDILKNEYRLDSETSHYLAYFCEGRLGKALRLKDKDVLIDKNRIIDNLTNVKGQYQDAEFNKGRFKEYLDILMSWFRDIYFLKIGSAHQQLINIDRKNDLLNSIGRYSPLELDTIFTFISNAALYLEQNVNPRLLLSNLRMVVSPALR